MFHEHLDLAHFLFLVKYYINGINTSLLTSGFLRQSLLPWQPGTCHRFVKSQQADLELISLSTFLLQVVCLSIQCR